MARNADYLQFAHTPHAIWALTTLTIRCGYAGVDGDSFLPATVCVITVVNLFLAPIRLVGLTGGMFNFIGGLGGIGLHRLVIDLSWRKSYGFAPALVYISVVALLGSVCLTSC